MRGHGRIGSSLCRSGSRRPRRRRSTCAAPPASCIMGYKWSGSANLWKIN